MGRTNKSKKRRSRGRRELIALATFGGLPVSELRRTPKTTEIALNDLRLSSVVPDPEFSRRLKRIYTGLAPFAFTRIPVADILPGFVQEDGGTRRVVSDPLSDAGVESARGHITRGHRPVLHLYEHGESDLAPYACADDQAALLAYQTLGFRDIPAALMDAHLPTPHARLLFQAVLPKAWPELFFLRAEPGARQDAPSLMAIQGEVVLETFFSECTNQLSRQLAALRSAHCVGEATHYHHLVASNIVRATRLLSAIRECVHSGVSEAAVILARSLYELSTAFYVDWLAPEQIGPAFASVAQIPKRDFRDMLKEIAARRQADGWSVHDAALASKGTLDAYDLAANVSAKARLTPLASTHNELYRILSGYAHQDAGTAASFAGYLERELDPSVADQQQFYRNINTVVVVANQALALLLQCVGSEFPVR